MISKNDILKMVKRVSRRRQGRADVRSIYPAREWTVGLVTTSILFIVVAVYAAYIFITFSQSVDAPVSVESSVVTYKKDRAQSVLETYRARKEKFDALRADKSDVAAPVAVPDTQGAASTTPTDSVGGN